MQHAAWTKAIHEWGANTRMAPLPLVPGSAIRLSAEHSWMAVSCVLTGLCYTDLACDSRVRQLGTVLRGGSWNNLRDNAAAARNNNHPDNRNNNDEVRVVVGFGPGSWLWPPRKNRGCAGRRGLEAEVQMRKRRGSGGGGFWPWLLALAPEEEPRMCRKARVGGGSADAQIFADRKRNCQWAEGRRIGMGYLGRGIARHTEDLS